MESHEPHAKPRHVLPAEGCASCRILWDTEVVRRHHARNCVNAIPPLGIHPVYTSPQVALCGMCLHRLYKFWIDTGEHPTCPHEAHALALYRASRKGTPEA